MGVLEGEACDVLVVGTGPAGNCAALACARAGLKVLQIERDRLPRRKVCGGGLSPRTLSDLPLDVGAIIERRIDAVWVCAGPERTLLAELARPGALICRERFDAFMAEAARAAGARLVDGCAFLDFRREPGGLLRVSTAQGTVRTRVLLGADGVHSAVRKRLLPGVRVRAVPAVEALLAPGPGVADLLRTRAVIDFGCIEGGYGWIFPKGDHLNVGLYRLRRTRGNVDLKQALLRFIATHPLLQDARIGDLRGFEIPIQAVSPRLAEGGVLLAGDAAGLGEAFYGEGICYAVRSGRLAGEAIVGHLRRGEALERYSRLLRAVRGDLLASRITAGAFYRMPRFGFERMVRNPFVKGLFAGVVTGTVSPWKCLLLSLLGAPWWLLGRRSPAVPIPRTPS